MSLIEEARAVRERIAARLAELEPLVREYAELRRAAAELGIEAAVDLVEAGPEPLTASEPAAPPSGGSRRGPAARRAARRRTTSRRESAASGPEPEGEADELGQRVLAAVVDHPGLTVGDYARELSLSQTLLYRPVRELTTSGQIVKRNRQLYPS